MVELASDRGKPAGAQWGTPLYKIVVRLAELHDAVAVAALRDSKTVIEFRLALLQAGETSFSTRI